MTKWFIYKSWLKASERLIKARKKKDIKNKMKDYIYDNVNIENSLIETQNATKNLEKIKQN